jgi:hypothetical protein
MTEQPVEIPPAVILRVMAQSASGVSELFKCPHVSSMRGALSRTSPYGLWMTI